MYTTLFENRDKKVISLLKLSDCLGRSLRENVVLFNIDDATKQVLFVTESEKIISGLYNLEESNINLSNITVQENDAFRDDSAFDSLVQRKAHDFVKGVFNDHLVEASRYLEGLTSVWETRLKFCRVQRQLHEKSHKFNETNRIVTTNEFQRFVESTPLLVKFIKENKEKILGIPEIFNAVRLSGTVADAFGFPRLSYDDLTENGTYRVANGLNESIYEVICRHELVKKELLENKEQFETIWTTNDSIQELAGCVFSEDDEVEAALSEAIGQIPYLALASKKSLRETFNNALSILDEGVIAEDDITRFVAKVFEMKKPVKVELLRVLSEEYGVNVQNLKDPASYSSLINTQVVVFESLARIAPKGSVLKETLAQVAVMLRGKTGVESIDVNDFLQEVFQISQLIPVNENILASFLDYEKIAGDLGQIGNVLRMIKMSAEGLGGGGMPGQEAPGGTPGQPPLGGGPLAQDPLAAVGGGPQPPPMTGAPQAPGVPQVPTGPEGGTQSTLDPGTEDPNISQEDEEEGMMDPNAMAQNPGAEDPMAAMEPQLEPDMGPEPEMPISMDQGAMQQHMSDLEMLMADLKMQLGGGEEEPMQGDDETMMGSEEMPGEEFGGEFGDEEDGEEFGAEGGEEFGGDDGEDFGDEEEDGEEEESDFPPKKEKKDNSGE